MNEMKIKTIQDLTMEFDKEIEILKRIQREIKIELKSSITCIENSGKALQVVWIK